MITRWQGSGIRVQGAEGSGPGFRVLGAEGAGAGCTVRDTGSRFENHRKHREGCLKPAASTEGGLKPTASIEREV